MADRPKQGSIHPHTSPACTLSAHGSVVVLLVLALALTGGCTFHGSAVRGSAREALAAATTPPEVAIALDGVPFEAARALWADGRLPGFCAPARMVAPFPSLTQPGHSDIWQAGAVAGYEERFYDGHRVEGGLKDRVFNARPDAYHDRYAFEESKLHGALIYIAPGPLRRKALSRLRAYLRSTDGPRSALLNSTDPVAHVGTDRVLRAYLEDVARVVDEAASRGARVTLFSDHGNDRMLSRRVDLPAALRKAGLRVSGSGSVAPGHVVIPTYGLVGFAAVHLDPCDRETAASALAATPGVELVAWEEEPGVVRLRGREGEARVRRVGALSDDEPGARFRYEPLAGDVLALGEAPRERDARGWLASAATDAYPDAPRRLVRAFSDALVRNRAAVLVSLEDGTHAGAAFLDHVVTLRGTHGGLGSRPSTGFVMTNWTDLPEVLRAEDVRRYLPGFAASSQAGSEAPAVTLLGDGWR